MIKFRFLLLYEFDQKMCHNQDVEKTNHVSSTKNARKVAVDMINESLIYAHSKC